MKTLTLLGLLVLLTVTAAHAGITTSGEVTASSPQTSPVWDLGNGGIMIGNYGPLPGTLTLTDGAEARMGNLTLHAGTIEVASGSIITVSAAVPFYIGEYGDALMAVRGSGSRIEIFDPELFVGYTGGDNNEAHVLIEDGGYLRSRQTTIGGASVGLMTVTGADSTWEMWTGELVTIGGLVSGELRVADGGRAQMAALQISVEAHGGSLDGSGRITVTGQGSTLETGAVILLSRNGTMIVEDGAYAGTTSTIHVGGAVGYGTLTVTGEDSVLDAHEIRMLANGTFNIGTGDIAGTVQTTVIHGDGAGVVNFNHTDKIAAGYTLTDLLQVNKLGSGSTSLTAANTYTGGTVVSAGTLLANNLTGSAFGTGAVTVESGASVGGAGFIGGLTTIESGGRLVAGAADHTIGTLTFDAGLVLENGAFLDFDLGATSDLVLITDGMFEVAGAILNFDAGPGYAPGVYTLLNWTGADAGEFSLTDFEIGSVTLGELSDYSLEIVGTTLQLTVDAAPIPEPSVVAALAGVGVLGLALWRRRAHPGR